MNEGDCDSDSDCLPGLVCSPNSCVGDTFDGFPFPDDCCQFPASKNTYGIRRRHRFRAAGAAYGAPMDYIGQQQQEMAAMQYGG